VGQSQSSIINLETIWRPDALGVVPPGGKLARQSDVAQAPSTADQGKKKSEIPELDE
jgi:hypothetical protein